MATLNSISSAIAPPSRTARAHLRIIYAAEKAVRERLDAIPFVTVGGESCAELLRVRAHLEAAAELLNSTVDREALRFEQLAV